MLSTKSLEKIAEGIEGKWVGVANALKVDKDQILEIQDRFENKRHCAMRMLDEWRFSSKAVERGMSITEDLMSALRTAGCDPSTIKLVEGLMPKT
ncbi:hypothetical protein FSP39_012676 [Pinctada imbricata]|uniref:Death domain-containing protein n=1 Tax=Pinctada imbricata TaxID=66713 RepID=A0AA88Y7L8_PINIB|nr:hypothetical protein FSP39_012676 [Pinctada imbricata]